MKAALFDLDGVIFNTESQYSVFWGGECRRYHPEIPHLENIIKGQTLPQILNGHFDDVKDEHQSIIKRLYEFEANMRYDYLPGLEAFLNELNRHGVKTAIVTSSNKEKMECVYSQHPECRKRFDAILTSEDFAESKPSPDCYLKAAACFNIKPKDCVVFEDSFNGLKSGRASGAYVVGLATTNSKEAIAPFADVVIDNFIGLTLNELSEIQF